MGDAWSPGWVRIQTKDGDGRAEGASPPLALFLRLSVGLKWIVGMRQTSCMGSASAKQEFFLSQPAPSRYRPRTQTPSWEDTGAGWGGRGDLPLPAPLTSPTRPASAPTLGGYTRLLSSTVETMNSQERLSTGIWGFKGSVREDPQRGEHTHAPSTHVVLAS